MSTSPSNDKKDIELEECEKKMNEENKAHDKISQAANDEAAEKDSETCGKLKADNIKEVKPKKIPTGGILMPGFFTRSKSKEKCKDGDSDGQTEEATELVEKDNKDDPANITQTRIKLPNPFRKSKLINEEDVEKGADGKSKKKYQMMGIRLPVSVFPKKKGDEQNLETQTKAGLASMETLDDNDKSADNKGEMKDVPLNEKAEIEEEDCMQSFSPYKVALLSLCGFILLTIVTILIIFCMKDRPHISPIKDGKYVKTITGCGVVEGILDDGAVAFRGIPYARPPLSDLRFQPSQPLNDIGYCWNGTFEAHNSTETCLQINNGEISGTEDCLTLDVVTPYVRYDSPLPVIVMIGAESLIGGSPGKMRPSSRYARSKDVVFVRPNFRLGVMGFLALQILSEDAYPHTSGNYGMMDIIEALRWVQLNIQHFGGDPKQVTLFGHKAGATLVTVLSTVRGAEKLFARAWATSGGATFPTLDLGNTEKENESFLSVVNCDDVSCLRNADAHALTNAIQDTWRKPQYDLPTTGEKPDSRHNWMVLDGKIMQDHPSASWTNENGLPVKLVLGTTAHSAASDKLLMKNKVWSEDLVAHHVRNSALSKLNVSEETLVMYPKTYKGLVQLISDIRIVCPLYSIATDMRNTTFYVVTQVRGEQNISDADSDVEAILGRYEPKTPEQRRYFTAIQQLFYHYVWHGKIPSETPAAKVLVVGQDALPAQNYSHCDYWIKKNVVPTYAHLD